MKETIFYIGRAHKNDAAFTLHQAAERAYACFLLVRSQYVSRATKLDRRRLKQTKRAYVEDNYAASYEIGGYDLQAIRVAVSTLRDTVEAVSLE